MLYVLFYGLTRSLWQSQQEGRDPPNKVAWMKTSFLCTLVSCVSCRGIFVQKTVSVSSYLGSIQVIDFGCLGFTVGGAACFS
uniref:Uncharacterized protein n=1 Tax=Aegilops tauschii subsp. strangulata TaxID=200361 RepID=A0A453HYD1_AEGTS